MVEIGPKLAKRESQFSEILFYFSVFIFGISLIFYFLSLALEKNYQENIQETENLLKAGKTEELINLEKEVQNWERKIKDMAFLLKEHVFATKFFKFLEEKTHPRVFFSKIELNLSEKNVSLVGQTDNFTLAQQALILKQEPLIFNLETPQLIISKEGGIGFLLKLSFKDQLVQK
jgi:hypothetical protein